MAGPITSNPVTDRPTMTLLRLGSGSGARAGEAGVASVEVMMSPNVQVQTEMWSALPIGVRTGR